MFKGKFSYYGHHVKTALYLSSWQHLLHEGIYGTTSSPRDGCRPFRKPLHVELIFPCLFSVGWRHQKSLLLRKSSFFIKMHQVLYISSRANIIWHQFRLAYSWRAVECDLRCDYAAWLLFNFICTLIIWSPCSRTPINATLFKSLELCWLQKGDAFTVCLCWWRLPMQQQ